MIKGNEYYEEGKDSATSPKYVVTDTGDNRTVAYVQPEEGGGDKAVIPDEVTLQDGQKYKVTEIKPGAFSNSKNLKNVDLPESLEEVGDYAFEGTAVKSITFKKNVKKLGKKACYNAKKLGKVTIKSKHLTKKSRVGSNAFGKTKKSMKIKIKVGSGAKAQKTKEKTINIFKSKRVGYKPTWKIS